MKRSVQDTPVVFIGAGNLATNLAKALYQNGFRIVQVYSRTKEAACALAQAIEAEYTTELSEVSRDARLSLNYYPRLLPGRKMLCWYIQPGAFR